MRLPKLNNQNVMAWGYISGDDGRGYNLVLIQIDGEPYGIWRMFYNFNSFISPEKRRPEPFPFSLDEIEEEMQYFNATHIYRTEVRELDIETLKTLKTFIIQYF